MTVSGLTGSPSRCCPRVPVNGLGSFCRPRSAFPIAGEPKDKLNFLRLDRCYWFGSVKGCNAKQTLLVKCAMDASYGGDMTNDQPVVFPRIHVRDPYKRLGISREASEDEIQAARNFLIHKYAGHKPSVDAIETAHDKIIMQKFYDRKNPKIDIRKKVREVKQSRVVLAIASRFQTPSTLVIIKTSIAFLVLGVLTVLFPTEEGPTLQGDNKASNAGSDGGDANDNCMVLVAVVMELESDNCCSGCGDFSAGGLDGSNTSGNR
ncbi:hypothetical protein GH714_034395 [Hevea brasiliensis]|uniref:Uncharacterized protein n=1 Tax=Hevea brasiliensis TaxID=3981 RepID=A0A6A6MIZ7_HEVBR|nr:hypothetical protein GH714_034395 [Hevea brasiliensis]